MDRQGDLAIVTIDRPEKLNAFTNAMYQSFSTIFRGLSGDNSVRCILIQATGNRAFCVGSDIGEFNASIDKPDRQIAETRIGREAMDALTDCPQPIVGAIEGNCVGGGFQIACACDLRVAGQSSHFGIPIKKLGMHAEIEDLETMYHALGQSLCLDLLLSGRMMGAVEAEKRGFVNYLAAPGTARDEAMSLAVCIAEGAPLAARWHKQALREIVRGSPLEQLANQALECYRHEDFIEGCAAFDEKRKPDFKGR
ncbi:MAG: enoyl-CoA hydratase/isomerase family protein [bacterium]|nr:enoyl-CoA hydratase/isomerase family protein [bacterium]